MTRLIKRYDKFLPTGLIAVGATLPLAAEAYVGPGAGLSLLTALWGIIAAIAMALFFVVMWPIRRMRRRRRAQTAAAGSDASTAQARTAQDPESPPSTQDVKGTTPEANRASQRP